MLKRIMHKLNSEDAQLTWLETLIVAVVAVALSFLLCVILSELIATLNLPEWMFIHHDCPNPKSVCL